MQHIAIGVSYDGAAWHGWQRQREVDTVQGHLERALSLVAQEEIGLLAAGRTDAGVHATGQVAAFKTSVERPLRAWHLGTNSHLPDSIRVNWAVLVDAEFHPRYSATARRYQYLWLPAAGSDPLLLSRAWQCQEINADAMHRAAQCLLGEHDFSSFRAAGCQSATPWRRVNRIEVRRQGAFVVLDIEANAFLLHMVRNIASGLYDVGTGKRSVADLAQLLARKARTLLGPTSPPQGLYLVGVSYPDTDLPALPSLALLG